VDTIVAALAGLATLAAHLEAGHGRPLASERVRLLLDVEVSPSSGKTACGLSHSRLDSTNVPSQLLVGSTPHARGDTQAGHRGRPVNGGQISAPTPEATFADLADLSEEPHEADGLDRLLHCANGNFRVLFVFIVLLHDRRRIVHFNVTEHPTEDWTAQQIREAFPWDEAPRYLIRDRDAIFGKDIVATTKAMGIEEVVIAPRSPWQNPYVERLIGSIRRECLDHSVLQKHTEKEFIMN